MTAASLAILAVKLWWLTICGLLLSYNIFLVKAWNRLRDQHKDTWEALGRPGLGNINPRVVFRSRKFLWSEEGRALGDALLSRQARLAYLCATTGAGMAVVTAAFILWASLRSTGAI